MAAAYSAIADGGILRAAAARPRPGRRRRSSEPPGKRVISARTAARAAPDARGGAGAGRHRVRGQRPRLHARRQDRDRPGGRQRRLLRHPVRRLVRGLRAGAGPAGCWSPWWSTSRRANYYGGTVAAPAFGEIAKFALPYLEIPPDQLTASLRSRRRPRIAAMELRELLAGADVAEIAGDPSDSRSPASPTTAAASSRGPCSSASAGNARDGHDFAPRGGRGRRGGAGRRARSSSLPVTQARVADARAAMAPAAVRFYGDPTARAPRRRDHRHQRQDHDRLPGPPHARGAGHPDGLLGTVKRVVGGVEEEVERTTPEAIDLQATFRRMLDGRRRRLRDGGLLARAGARTAPTAIHFAVAVFTNLTQDHLDFHADMEDYFRAKRACFVRGRTPGSRAVVNVDDPYGARLAAELRGRPPPLPRSRPRAPRAPTSARSRSSFDAPGSRFRAVGPGGEVAVRTAAAGPLQRRERACARSPPAHALGVAGRRRGRGARRRRPGPGALRAGRRRPAIRGPGRLRAHPRLARERPARRPPADRRGG